MKNLLLFVFTISIFAISCGDDCTQEDWLGVYNVAVECTGEDAIEDSISITAGSNENEILFDGDALTIDGCTASATIMDSGLEFTIDLELDGDNISGTQTGSFLGIPVSCTLDGSK